MYSAPCEGDFSARRLSGSTCRMSHFLSCVSNQRRETFCGLQRFLSLLILTDEFGFHTNRTSHYLTVEPEVSKPSVRTVLILSIICSSVLSAFQLAASQEIFLPKSLPICSLSHPGCMSSPSYLLDCFTVTFGVLHESLSLSLNITLISHLFHPSHFRVFRSYHSL